MGSGTEVYTGELVELMLKLELASVFFFQAEDGIRDHCVTGVQTCALPIYYHQDESKQCHILMVVNSNAMRSTIRTAVETIDDRGFLATTRDDPQWLDVETRSEERRVGKECRSRWSPYH